MTRTTASILFCAFGLTGCLGPGSGREAADNVYVLEGTGTPEACKVSDTQCLENKFYVVCDPDSATVIETCLNWLAELEGFPEPVHDQIRLLTATTYYRLSEIRRRADDSVFPHLDGQGAKLLSADRYLAKVRELAREVYNNDRNNIGAMRYLSLTSASDEESLQWQRRIVRAETPGAGTCWLLHSALSRVYDAPGKRRRAYAESARCYMTSYREAETQPGKWNMAGAAVNSLERAGQTLARNRFLAEVIRDIDPDRRLRELASLERLAPDEAEFTLQTLCMGSVREMLGADYCSMAIDAALHSVSGMASEMAVPFAETVMEGMMTRLRPTGMVQTEDLTSFMEEAAIQVEREVLSKGLASGKIHSIYSRLVRHDPGKSIDALVKAIEFEPQNAEYRVWLGDLHAQRGELELAKQQYRQALKYFPEFRQKALLDGLRYRGIELD